MLHPCIQVNVNSRESGSGKPLFGASTFAGFNVVVHKDTLVGTFNRSPGLELFLECLCVSWDRKEKPEIIIRLDIDGSAIGAV